jgi:hypothetical protein
MMKSNGEAQVETTATKPDPKANTNGGNRKKAVRKPTKPTTKAKSEKPDRVPVPKASLEKLAAAGGKVRIIAARDAKLVGRTAEVVSVATVDKKAYAFGYFPRIKVDGKVRNVSPANVKVV